ncbi:MAG TPA: mechanosensitive ion channel family protein [Firmicutes bacterium]|nr:mechanosensitive ion channel family protein [Bacillota bacterium]
MYEAVEAFQAYIASSLLREIAAAVTVFIFFLVFRKIFVKYIFKIILKLTKRTKTDLDDNILLSFESPLGYFFLVLGLYFSLSILPLTAYQDMLLLELFRALIVILVTWGFYNFIGTFLFWELGRKFGIELDKILIPFLVKMLRLILVALALIIIADEWGYNISAFITGLGLGGLAISLAAKDALANIIGGIVILTEKPFSIGDWIYTPSVEGTVEDISFRSTRVRTFAQALVTVPNSTLAGESITNWTRMGKRRITFNLRVTLTTPKEKLKRCVQKIRDMLENHPEIHKETIFVRFDQFNESSLDIFLYFFTVTTIWGEFLRVKEDVNFKIMEILEQEGVSIAFPSRSVYLETPVDVNRHVQGEQDNI